jgi:hypothetical protein
MTRSWQFWAGCALIALAIVLSITLGGGPRG